MGRPGKRTRPPPHQQAAVGGTAANHVVASAAEDSWWWWRPGPGVNWDWRISGTPRASAGVEMFYVDLFDVTTNQIRILQDANIVVICSFSAGTYEENREDEDNFPLTAIGNLRADSEGEYWIDINHEGILSVMNDRLDQASEKGCDGVGPDAVEAYALGFEVTGCDISAADQLTYNQWLANQAHARNLSVGLRNDVDQLTELEPYFDWALTTDCYTLGLCDEYDVFTVQEKAVVAAEFLVGNLTLCNSTYAESIDFIVKGSELDDQRCSCGFPDTDMECSSLLAANIPTEPPSSGGVSEDGTPSPMGDGSEVEAAPAWLIVTVIAVVVFIAMVAGGAYAWRERLKRLGKWGDSTTQGVDDFCT